MHLNHVGCDATECERSLDALVNHALADILDSCQRSATRTGLDREALLEVAAIDNNLGSLLCKKDVARVLCIANST